MGNAFASDLVRAVMGFSTLSEQFQRIGAPGLSQAPLAQLGVH